MKKIILTIILALTVGSAYTQNISSKSNEIALDFSGGKKNYATSAPSIKWQMPLVETAYVKEGKLPIQVEIRSKSPLKSVTISYRDKKTNEPKGKSNLSVSAESSYILKIDKDLIVPEGIIILEITAENESGVKSLSSKIAYSGEAAVAGATKLDRKDYALLFVTDKYDNWKELANPVFDGRTISQSLQRNYGFKTEVVENPTREQVFLKLREYAEKKFNPLDQLLVFFAGHGFYDETFKEGFIVPKESVQDDPGRTSYIRHSEIRGTINNSPCEHVMLVMDVCFGGTFDEEASRSLDEAIYGEATQSDVILRKLQYKTRKYITSGGKEYVADGVAGSHSPFAKQFIEALESQGSADGILTLSELKTFLEKLKTEPKFGKFGSDRQGSEFVFVVK